MSPHSSLSSSSFFPVLRLAPLLLSHPLPSLITYPSSSSALRCHHSHQLLPPFNCSPADFISLPSLKPSSLRGNNEGSTPLSYLRRRPSPSHNHTSIRGQNETAGELSAYSGKACLTHIFYEPVSPNTNLQAFHFANMPHVLIWESRSVVAPALTSLTGLLLCYY